MDTPLVSRPRRERGAVTTIFAVLLVMGVVMGFGALSLDMGRLLVEKRQLQNSADAAALSLATSCWRDSIPLHCTAGADDLQGLVDKNAEDRFSGIESQCQVNMSGIGNCGVASGALADCSPLPDQYATMTNLPYVEVRTKTQSSDGSGGRSDGLTNWLAGMIGYPTGSVGACARAAVGSAMGGETTLPIAISACEWLQATGGSSGGGGPAVYPPSPDYTVNPGYGYSSSTAPTWPLGAEPTPTTTSNREVVLKVQNPPSGQTPPPNCPNWNGHSLPGGFGLLEVVGSDPCDAKRYDFNWFHTNPGSSTSCDLSRHVGKVVNLPIYACTLSYNPMRPANEATDPCTTGSGSNSWYWASGYVKFYLSGFSMTTTAGVPNSRNSINPRNTLPSSANPCSSSESCISGWFLEGAVRRGSITGPPSGAGYFGAWTVVPLG